MAFVALDEMKLVGIKLPFKTSNSGGQSAKDCGGLWQKFESDKVHSLIQDKLGNEVYAVYYDYESDHTQPYAYFIGCRVKQETQVPADLDSITIPKGLYLHKNARGPIPDCIAEAWKDIWLTAQNRAYQYDFEIYDERSHDWKQGEVDIMLSMSSSE